MIHLPQCQLLHLEEYGYMHGINPQILEKLTKNSRYKSNVNIFWDILNNIVGQDINFYCISEYILWKFIS